MAAQVCLWYACPCMAQAVRAAAHCVACFGLSLSEWRCRYAVLVDGAERKGGSLFEDFEPAINPPEEVDDPEDSKPSTWVDTPKCAASAE